MATVTFTVTCEWDDEAQMWYVASSDVPGLSGEAPSREAMAELLQVRVCELVQLNRPELVEQDEHMPPLELLIQSREKLRLPC
jgi:hypothetical protein